jgi:putative ATPase
VFPALRGSQSLPFNHSPICSRQVSEQLINQHIDAGCRDARAIIPGPSTTTKKTRTQSSESGRPVAPIFFKTKTGGPSQATATGLSTSQQQPPSQRTVTNRLGPPQKRKLSGDGASSGPSPFAAHVKKQSKATSTIGSRLQAASPLAERLRPSTLDEFVGQAHLTGPGSFLFALTEKGVVGSVILWGPPG